MKAFEAET